MKKAEFIKEIARRTLLTQKDVAAVIEAAAGTIKDELASNGEIVFPGIGKFKLVDVAARECRNPATGGVVMVPAHKMVKVKITKNFMGC
jgi:DNA-binding protein HU-beta